MKSAAKPFDEVSMTMPDTLALAPACLPRASTLAPRFPDTGGISLGVLVVLFGGYWSEAHAQVVRNAGGIDVEVCGIPVGTIFSAVFGCLVPVINHWARYYFWRKQVLLEDKLAAARQAKPPQ